MKGVRAAAAVAFAVLWFGSGVVLWIGAFLAYFNNFTGLAKFAGLFLIPMLALPIVGKGTIAPSIHIAVHTYWWWGLTALSVVFGVLAAVLGGEE